MPDINEIDTPNLEGELRSEYLPKVKEVTLDELPAFIAEIMDREHDYGSICVALGIVAAASAWACNKHPNGGITGFQAGAVFWEFVRAWGTPDIGESGTRIVNFDDLLYPQYADKFGTVSADVLATVREMAAKRIADAKGDLVAPAVLQHWQQIADGYVPFGLRVVS